MTMEHPGRGTSERGFNGMVAWEFHPTRGARLVEGEERTSAMRNARFNADAAWRTVYAGTEVLGVETVDGRECYKLRLTPNQYLLWYEESQGTLVSKLVTGDFKATTIVRARRASNPSLAPDQHIHLAGLMARKPGNGSENYVFIVVGNDEQDLSVETKSTTNGVSDYDGPSWGSGDAELRICRIGGVFTLYKRTIGAPSWTLAATYQRGDLPLTLEVGPNVYAAASAPDLEASFDEVRFEGVCDLAGCVDG
jgi:hypothetical protein